MIDFKEGAVCYACGKQWVINTSKGGYDFMAINDLDYCNLKFILGFNDFQLNEPREGYYIPKSELEPEEKYSKAIDVFGLFGYEDSLGYERRFNHCKSELLIIFCGAIDSGKFDSCFDFKHKLTFEQLMAIGELKRKMNERDAVKKGAEMYAGFIESRELDVEMIKKLSESVAKAGDKAANAMRAFNKAAEKVKSAKKRKSKEAYRILESMGIEWDNVEGKWFKVSKEWL